MMRTMGSLAVDSIRSCLLLSTDNGKSWRDTGLFMAGCNTVDLFVLDARRAWVLVGWSIEGDLPPYYSFATTDGGRTWTRSRVGLPDEEGTGTGISYGYAMSFRDATHGEFVYIGSDCHRRTYETSDAGATWRCTGNEPLGADDAADGAAMALVDRPSSLRTDWKIDRTPRVIVVEESPDGGKTWRYLCELPAEYPIGNDDVAFP